MKKRVQYILPFLFLSNASILQYLGVPSIATVFFFLCVFITVSYPLSVSAPMGHLHMEYILANS
jgi:hypothetical protein